MNNYDIGNLSASLPDEIFANTRMNDNHTTAPSSQEFHYNADMNLLASQQLQPQNTGCNKNLAIQNEDSMSGFIGDFEEALVKEFSEPQDLRNALNDENFIRDLLEEVILPTSELNQNHLEQPSSSSTYLMQSAPNNNFSMMQSPSINQNHTSIETTIASCNQYISLKPKATDLSALTSLSNSSTTSNRWMLHSPASNFNDSTFQTSTGSSSSMLIQSNPSSDLNNSTVLEPLSSSGGQPYMELPCSYQLQLALQQQAQQQPQQQLQQQPQQQLQQQLQQQQLPQQQPINNTAILNISIQPENNFRFRYEKEIHNPHGYLPGTGSVGKNLRKFTTVDLRFNQNNEVVGEYFVRCTLHQASFTPKSIHHAPLSPHQLLRRRSDNGFYHETELYPLRKVGPNLYRFEMTNFLILCPSTKKYMESCRDKFQKLIQQNYAISSKLICDDPKNVENSAFEAQEVANGNCKNEKSAKKGKKKTKEEHESATQKLGKQQFSKVQIGFEAFQFIDNSNKSIADPIFSNVIIDGGHLNIIKICNLSVLKNQDTEVTLLVSPLKTTNIEIHIEERGNIENPWRECILVKKKMVHHNSAISFRAPRYGGTRQDVGSITCSIQLERICDGARSNAKTIIYENGIKRNRSLDNDFGIRPIFKIKCRRNDFQVRPDFYSEIPVHPSSSAVDKLSKKCSSPVEFLGRTPLCGKLRRKDQVTTNTVKLRHDAVFFTEENSPSEVDSEEDVISIVSQDQVQTAEAFEFDETALADDKGSVHACSVDEVPYESDNKLKSANTNVSFLCRIRDHFLNLFKCSCTKN